MHVFFHLKDGNETIGDVTGVEVSDLEEARTEALRAVAEMRRGGAGGGRGGVGWWH